MDREKGSARANGSHCCPSRARCEKARYLRHKHLCFELSVAVKRIACVFVCGWRKKWLPETVARLLCAATVASSC